MISVVINQTNLIISTSDIREEIYDTENPIQTIKDFVEKIEKYSLFILSNKEINESELLGLENALVGVDIEIAGVFAYKTLKIPSILVVSNLFDSRSCVVLNGKVLKNGSNCGNINKLSGFSIIEAIIGVTELFIDSQVLLFECKDSASLKAELLSKSIKIIDLELDSESLASRLKEFI